MQILKNNVLIPYDYNLKNNNGRISFETGENIIFNNNIEYIVPGFIDQHIHGLLNFDTMDGTELSLQTQSLGLLREGTTSFFPTTMTAKIDDINPILKTIRKTMSKTEGAEILGVHLEGPFISKDKIGAQNPSGLETLSIDNIKKIIDIDIIKLLTYAPELDIEYKFTKYLEEKNIIPSIGHSNANTDQVINASNNGLKSFTHLHNASSGYDHRNPGVVLAAYLIDNAHVELIVDGEHVCKEAIMSVYKNIGYQRINLITDAMRAKSMIDGEYDLGGQVVVKKGDTARLKNGTLAGSVLKMNDAIKNMIELSGCSVEEAFQMASYNQTKLLKIENKGLIKESFDFDITCLDSHFNVIQVFKKGKEVYNENSC